MLLIPLTNGVPLDAFSTDHEQIAKTTQKQEAL